MSETTLKPCPFCGKQPDLVRDYGLDPKARVVCCNDCLVGPETKEHDSIEDVIFAWNHRAKDRALAAKDAEIERLTKALEEIIARVSNERLCHFGTHTGYRPQIGSDEVEHWRGALSGANITAPNIWVEEGGKPYDRERGEEGL